MTKISLFIIGAFLFANVGLCPAKGSATSTYQDSIRQTDKFSGMIIRNGDKFILSDSVNKMSYGLDDAEKASQFVGKKVLVTGTLDAASNTIHVATIVEVA